MRGMQFWLYIAVAGLLALAVGGAHAATTMWLSTDVAGTPVPGDTITVESGGQATLYCFMESTDIGNTYEVMVGYDVSDGTTYGAGVDTNDGASKKLTLFSQKAEIVGTIPAGFDVFSTAGYADAQVVLDASGREAANGSLGGRPYGFIGRAATTSNAAPGQVMCFSFVLQNNMTNGDSQSVVVSNHAGGASYSSAWKYGTGLFEDSYSLLVVSGAATEKDAVGTAGRSLAEPAAQTAASQYDWVVWGKAHVIDADSFTIDDGSGITVTVNAASHGVTEDTYVSVRGDLSYSGNDPIVTTTSDKITVQD